MIAVSRDEIGDGEEEGRKGNNGIISLLPLACLISFELCFSKLAVRVLSS